MQADEQPRPGDVIHRAGGPLYSAPDSPVAAPLVIRQGRAGRHAMA